MSVTTQTPWSLLLAAMLVQAGCSREERYQCGIMIDGDVTQCDGVNEICVCGSEKLRYCAVYDESCEKTHYRYVFGENGGCVDELESHVEADLNNPENALCPEVASRPEIPKSCGTQDKYTRSLLTCDEGRTCVCGPSEDGGVRGACALPDSSCPSEYFAGEGCVPLGIDEFVTTIAPTESCPAVQPKIECGRAGEDGRLLECPEGLKCACKDGEGACVQDEVDRNICASRRMYKNGTEYKQCAPSDATITENGLCEGAPSPPAIPCGERTADNRIAECDDDEACMCSSDGGDISGVCGKTGSEITCLSGVELVHDGTCFSREGKTFAMLLPSDASLCPLSVPDEVPCGDDIAEECRTGVCLCSSLEPKCVVQDDACESRLAFSGTLRCVGEDDEGPLVATGTCEEGDQ